MVDACQTRVFVSQYPLSQAKVDAKPFAHTVECLSLCRLSAEEWTGTGRQGGYMFVIIFKFVFFFS